jgi:hypothetical protein
MINYDVALHSSHWPTFQALQECIDRHRWPIKLGGEGSPQWTKPLGKERYKLGIPMVFKGEPIELKASFYTVGSNQSLDVNGVLARIGATHVHFEEGDRVLRLTFRVNIKEYQAGFYVMAALIKCFGGYAFQGGSHGTSGYADSLIAEAARLESEGPTPINVDHIKRAADAFVYLARKRKGGDPKQ